MSIGCCQGSRMRAAGAVGLLLLAWSTLSDGQEPPQLNRSLKILYAGRPGSDREKDFVAFLKEHFDTVRTGDLREFKEADARNVDVTLLDWDNGVFKGPCPQLSERFSRPVITLGVHGGFICQQWQLKTGYW